MTSEDEVNSRSILFPSPVTQEITVDNLKESNKRIESNKVPELNSCQYCCCRFPKFIGSTVTSSRDTSIFNSAEYKPYFELETEEERLSYEYFMLFARVTYDKVVEKYREQALGKLHQYHLRLLLEELRLIEETDILYSSSDKFFSQFEIRIPNKQRSLRIQNKKLRFQKQRFRKFSVYVSSTKE